MPICFKPIIFPSHLFIIVDKTAFAHRKRDLRPEKSGGDPASACESPLFCHFMEKASMENCFWALKSPQTRMKPKKNGPVIYYDRPRWWRRMDSDHRS